MAQTTTFDVTEVRSHLDFPTTDRVVTNHATTTQPPRELIQLFARLAGRMRVCSSGSCRPREGIPLGVPAVRLKLRAHGIARTAPEKRTP